MSTIARITEFTLALPKFTVVRVFFSSPVQAMHTCLVAVPLWMTFNLLFLHSFYRYELYFRWFDAHGTENQWAFRFAVLAALGSVGLFTRNTWPRLASAVVLGVGHAMIACGFYLGNPQSLSMGVYVILATMATWRIYLE
jgi:hypothetical protein